MPRRPKSSINPTLLLHPLADELHWGNINLVILQCPGTTTPERWGKLSLIWFEIINVRDQRSRKDCDLVVLDFSLRSKPPETVNMSLRLHSWGRGGFGGAPWWFFNRVNDKDFPSWPAPYSITNFRIVLVITIVVKSGLCFPLLEISRDGIC